LHTLILLLQRRPGQKAAELADALGVSVRTLHRYLAALEEMGIPIYAERGPAGGISLVPGYRLPPLMFSPEEAVAVCLGASLVEQVWGTLYVQAAAGAMAKVENVLPGEQRAEIAWARQSLHATGMHRTDPSALAPLLERLRIAAHERRQVEMLYQGSSGARALQRLVDPYALVHRAGWWYLVGYCHLRQALRTFRLDRILRLELCATPFEAPSAFNLQAHLESEFKDQKFVEARLRFVPEAAHVAHANRSTWQSLQENSDGSIEVVATAPDLTWMASLVLGFATLVTVLEPAELRHMVRQWALAIAAQYPPEQIVEGTT
jgi:predicted DNA-binding transcriptional regulator YafY